MRPGTSKRQNENKEFCIYLNLGIFISDKTNDIF